MRQAPQYWLLRYFKFKHSGKLLIVLPHSLIHVVVDLIA